MTWRTVEKSIQDTYHNNLPSHAEINENDQRQVHIKDDWKIDMSLDNIIKMDPTEGSDKEITLPHKETREAQVSKK
jgi:hypothetical protein